MLSVLVLLTLTLFINVSDVSAANSTFNTTSISNSADTVKTYVETNKNIPTNVTVANQNVTPAQYLYLLTSSVQNINKSSTTPITLKNVSNPTSPSETVTSGTLTKNEYLSLANQIITFINTNGRLPNYVTTSVGTMRYENLIYTYAKIMSFYKANNRLPNTVSVAAFPPITEGSTNTPSNGTTNQTGTTTVTFTTSQITTAAANVKAFTETNYRLPETVTISKTSLTMAQFLQLLTDGFLQLNSGSTSPVTVKVVKNPTNQSETVTAGTLTKAEYTTLVQQIKNIIDTTGTAPATMSTSLGTMKFENLVYTYAKIMAFYQTNNRLPNTVSVKAFSSTTNSSVSAILDSIGKAEAKYGDVQGVSDLATFVRLGYGDCWADSLWLYTQLTSAGLQSRIMGYVGGGYGVGYRHAWVQINIGNGWVNWNYKGYNSQHYGDVGCGTPYVLIGPGVSNPSIVSTGY